MSRPVPATLAKRGITGIADNLPPGAGLDIARDFVRIFRPEIEARVLGWKTLASADPARPRRRATVPPAPTFQGAQP